MLRIDHALHDELVKKKGCSEMIMKGKLLSGYIVVGESITNKETGKLPG